MPSPFTDDFWRAVATYGVTMPSLGTGNPPAIWLAEFNRVQALAQASVLLIKSASESAVAEGVAGLPQKILQDALWCYRFDLDPSYVLPVHLAAYPAAKIQRGQAGSRRGITLRFGQ